MLNLQRKGSILEGVRVSTITEELEHGEHEHDHDQENHNLSSSSSVSENDYNVFSNSTEQIFSNSNSSNSEHAFQSHFPKEEVGFDFDFDLKNIISNTILLKMID